ncbi:paraquat-inducible protein A [Roseibacillus ishigakijimensis]|uniref:Paraquat-inducible protein A n=1 Tax=Roseibacillus ishigakijimensis TaxID=454146 RepID=A0A934RNZ3_9BACT|nr:paraquat-inducible protein A [Roseibacillus ishigakijimensis]MBK1834310.1 paraquat-inducible protein A [Roseibacillus ishigakijimensis]
MRGGKRGETALSRGLASCHTCGRLQPLAEHHCQRCGSAVHARKPDSLQRCLALSIASLIAYIPANVMPIMVVTQLGVDDASTIMSGVVTFWQMHAYPVAITIFVASVLIPGLKLIALAVLCAAAAGKWKLKPQKANRIYWLTELVGRWSMVDVFVVAILVGLVKFTGLMTIAAGPAAIAFGLMVILTMFAAHAFDPKLIWDRVRATDHPPTP